MREPAVDLVAPESEWCVGCVVAPGPVALRCGGCARVGERGDVDNAQQFVDVDVLHRGAAAHDVVAGAHDLDTRAVEVGVQIAGAEEQCLTGFEGEPVHEQGDDHTRIAGVLPGEPIDQHGFGLGASIARGECAGDRQRAPIERLYRAGQPIGAHCSGQVGGTEPIEQGEGGAERPEPAEGVERCDRADEFGLRERVAVGALRGVDGDAEPFLAGISGGSLVGRRVGLQAQWFRGDQHLEQIGERPAPFGEWPRGTGVVGVDGGRAARVRSQPQFGPRLPVGLATQQLR